MPDWFQNLMSGFVRAVQITGANQRPQEQQAEQALRQGQNPAGAEGVAAALGTVAANAGSTNSERLVDREFPVKFRQGGCDVHVERNDAEEPIRLRVKSLIYVYSDVVSPALLQRKTAKIQAQINNYWNNRIPVTRTLTLTSVVGGTLSFAYGDLPPLSVAPSGVTLTDAMAFAAQWRSDPGYDAIGNVEVELVEGEGTLLVTFIDDAARSFVDSSTVACAIAETIPPIDPARHPVGTNFQTPYQTELRAMGSFTAQFAPPPPRPNVDIVFDVEAMPYTFAPELDAAGRTREMNRLRDEMVGAAKNLLWVHLNDNEDPNFMTSWASGGLGSFRVNAWPGEYAHEMGHFMGHWANSDPDAGTYDPSGEHYVPPDPNTVITCIMGSRSSKSHRRVEQADIGCLNFASGLGGIPTRFPGSVLREKLANERKTVGALISAQLPDGSFVRDQVIYLDMSNFATARPQWNLGD